MLMPTTHYDWIRRFRPDFVDALAASVANLPDRKFGLARRELDEEWFLKLSKATMAQRFRDTIRSNGGVTEQYSDQDILEMAPPDMVAGLHQILELEWRFFSNFEAFGKKSFFLSPNLTAKLADTELNLASELVVTPFPACLFVYDNQTARDAFFAMVNAPTRLEGVVSAYVVYYLTEEDEPGLAILATHSDRRGEMAGAVVRHLSLAPGTKLEDALRTDWMKLGKARADAVSAEDDERFFGAGLRMMRIIANSILYLSSSNPDVAPGLREPQRTGGSTPSTKEKRRLERSVTKLDYILVGRSTSGYQGIPSSTGKALTERIKVRGHWRNQAHGPGYLERTLRFIEPFWRGPDAAEIINKDYFVR